MGPHISLVGPKRGYSYWQARCGCGWTQISGFRAFVKTEAAKHARKAHR